MFKCKFYETFLKEKKGAWSDFTKGEIDPSSLTDKVPRLLNQEVRKK